MRPSRNQAEDVAFAGSAAGNCLSDTNGETARNDGDDASCSDAEGNAVDKFDPKILNRWTTVVRKGRKLNMGARRNFVQA